MSGFIVSDGGFVIAAVSIGLAFMNLAVRKVLVDQDKVKKNRGEIKELQKQVKESQKAGDSKEVSRLYSRIMEINSEVMKQSFKPMLLTLIPFILVFGWMRGNYDNTMVDVAVVNKLPEGVVLGDVNVSDGGFYNKTTRTLLWQRGVVAAGNYSSLYAELDYGGGHAGINPSAVYYKRSSGDDVFNVTSNSTEGIVFLQEVEDLADGKIKISLFYNNTKSNIIATVFGFELGWFGWYILCSMIASLALNKVFHMM